MNEKVKEIRDDGLKLIDKIEEIAELVSSFSLKVATYSDPVKQEEVDGAKQLQIDLKEKIDNLRQRSAQFDWESATPNEIKKILSDLVSED